MDSLSRMFRRAYSLLQAVCLACPGSAVLLSFLSYRLSVLSVVCRLVVCHKQFVLHAWAVSFIRHVHHLCWFHHSCLSFFHHPVVCCEQFVMHA